MKYLVFLSLYFLSFNLFCQDLKEIDSLKLKIKTTDNDSIKAGLLIKIGGKYERLSALDSATYFVKEAINLSKNKGVNYYVARGYIVLGNFSLNKYNYKDAFINYVKADSICESDSNLKVSKIHAQAYNYIGYSVRLTHDYDRAGAFYLKAKDMYTELNYEAGIQEVNIGLAQLYINKEKYDEALSLFNTAVSYHKKNGPENSYTYAVICRGFLLLNMKRYSEAEKDYLEYYNVINQSNDKVAKLRGFSYMGSFYYESGNLLKAIDFYNQGIKMAKEENNLFMQKEIQEGLIDVYNKQNNSVKLNSVYKEYILVRNKMDSIDKNREIYKLEAQYQTQKKEQEIALLKSENELTEQQKTNQRNLFLAGIGLTSLAGIFFFFLYRNRQKTTNKLKDLDNFKSKIFENISHEFRTPLTLISGPIEKRLSSDALNKEDRLEFEMIQRNSSRLLNLVNQLLDLSKLETGHLKLKVSKDDLSVLLKAIASSFNHLANEKHIEYLVDISPIKDVWFDKDVIEKVVTNLLSNAFKYSEEKKQVKFQALVKNNLLEMYVENDGKIITKDHVESIFNRFYQAENHKDGLGIGLSLVKELVTLSHGKITVENTTQHTVEFIVVLPILESSFNQEELDIRSEETVIRSSNEIDASDELVAQSIDENKAILLIVDDHADIRTFIKNEFKATYQIVEAVDGEEGISKAIQLVPDIIISDVMMPKVNGFELAAQLKQDERTSHIPIILLTAKVEEENQFKGLSTGADDYITKPFKVKLLEKRIHNLVVSRDKLRERYSQELILRPKDISVTSIDEQFLEKLQSVLDAKLTESSFSIEDFSKAVGMSRMQLHRKLKALTGLSATEFVRSQRLKLAASLLKKSDVNISEIGYMVGFNDHSYFAKCFKEAYGCSPSEFTNK